MHGSFMKLLISDRGVHRDVSSDSPVICVFINVKIKLLK